jgi:hypothetical protein
LRVLGLTPEQKKNKNTKSRTACLQECKTLHGNLTGLKKALLA